MAQESQRTPPRNAPQGQRKRRRRKKHMNPILYILLVVAVSAVLAGLGWIWAGDVLALNKESHSADLTLTDDIFTYHDEEVEVTRDGVTQTVTRTVSQADMDYVADQLKENGLIEYKALFKLFAAFSHASSKLEIGRAHV